MNKPKTRGEAISFYRLAKRQAERSAQYAALHPEPINFNEARADELKLQEAEKNLEQLGLDPDTIT